MELPGAAQSGSEALRTSWPSERPANPTGALAAGGGLFAFGMFALCHAWVFVVQELLASPQALASFALQQAIVWVAYLLVDERCTRRSTQLTWAALGTLYATVTFLDGLLMRMTSLPMREILPMLLASRNMIEGLREIGLRPLRVVILFIALLMAAFAGGGVRLLLGSLVLRSRFAKRANVKLPRASLGVLVVLVSLFGVEQALARDQPDYLYRGFHMPEYVQIYSTSSRSITLSIPPPVRHEQRSEWLKNVGTARNPRHVLYVLLESFRADAVDPAVSPTMVQLGREGTQFDRALAEATYTPLSWSVLLFDEAAHDNLFGRYPGRQEPLGSWLLAVMKKAGYTPHVYVSTNLTYAKTRDRLLGPEPHSLDFFQAASDEGEDPADKNKNDRVAVDRVLQFIQKHDWKQPADPQFMLLQLDSTHYTYPFPEDHALFKPYSENLTLPRPIETEAEAKLLTNRYKNAANYVDSQLKRVIEGLKRAGVYEDTAIVLTADHGEGLKPGSQGHAAVFDATRHVPLILKLPGQDPRHASQLVSHRDILPMLANYLQIDLPQAATRGRAGGQELGAVLTLAPSGRFGQLVTRDRVVDLRLLFEPTMVTVTPANADAQTEAEWLPLLKSFLQSN
ncbi:MAG TPA: sulfatase-like hydrolase/transferase [Polyangiales bacterium]|nr:sulfatase-like hydrolase/transferase [Polyangiales bacterium]